MRQKKLGLPSVVATGVGLIVATSCLLSIGQGTAAIGLPFIITMIIACAFNILTAFSICELNALMPNLTGGMAQYTLACFGPFISIVITVGGYLTCQTIMGSSEAAMFGNTLSSVFSDIPIPASIYSIVLILILAGLNWFGVDMFAKIQNIVAYGLIHQRNVYEDFIKGAKDGFQTVIQIMPTLIGLMVAVGVLRASGFLHAVGKLFGSLADKTGFPSELIPLVFVKMFSSSAATGLVLDIFKTHGPDSYIGMITSIMMSCTETIFYTMSVYFLAAKVTKTRYTLPGALLATLAGIIASVILAGIVS